MLHLQKYDNSDDSVLKSTLPERDPESKAVLAELKTNLNRSPETRSGSGSEVKSGSGSPETRSGSEVKGQRSEVKSEGIGGGMGTYGLGGEFNEGFGYEPENVVTYL